MACEVFEPCEWWRAFGFLLAELRAEEFDFVFELLPGAFLGWGLRIRVFLWEWSFNGFPQNGFLARRDFRRNTTGGVGIGESGVYVVDGEHCLSYCVTASTPLVWDLYT